jgi:hypothetical protein
VSLKSRIILSKVERAKKHVEDLESRIRAFFDSAPDTAFRIEDDFHTRQRTYYLARVPEIPLDIANTIGDVLHNLRSALDHIAYRLPRASNARAWTQFPIAESAAKYMSPKIRGKVQVFRKDVVEALDALKPYKGGNDALWRLHELNKIDKHRLLLTTSISNTHRSMTPTEKARMIARYQGSHPGNSTVPDLSEVLIRIQPVALNAGDKFLTIPHSEMEDKVHLHFDVAFNEPQVIEANPVVETLHEMAKLVGDIVVRFDPLLT